jgi:glycosyltransferase involved in cell wall biosynthesis
MKVEYIFRKQDPRFFSLENVFRSVMAGIGDRVAMSTLELPMPGVSLRNLLFLRRSRSRGHDVIHHVTGDAHYVVFALPRARTVLTIHDCVFLDQYKGVRRQVVKWVLLDLPVRYLRYITTISEKTRAEVIGHTGCDPKKIRVIGNPVSPAFQEVVRLFNEERPRILFLGTTPNKNLERTVKALEGLDCHLRIIGKLDEHQDGALKNAGIEFSNAFSLSDAEIVSEYQEADLLLFPTLYEGFGLPVIEAFRCGLAVVTSDLEPMSGVAGDAACLVDPLDPASIRAGVQKVIQDRDHRTTLIDRGRQRGAQFDPREVATRYLDLYEEMI